MVNNSERLIVVSEAGSAGIVGFPRYWLPSFYEQELMPRLDRLLAREAIDCERGKWLYRSGLAANPTLDKIVESALLQRDSSERIRLIGHTGPIMVTGSSGLTGQRNLIAVELWSIGSADPPGWGPVFGPATSRAVVKPVDFPHFMSDVATDIMVANSENYLPIIQSILQGRSIDALYREKVQYCLERKFESAIGPISKDAGYVCFASVARRNAQLRRMDFATVSAIWDDFFLTKFRAHVKDPRDAVSLWRPWSTISLSRSSVSHRISEKKLREEIDRQCSDAGSYILLIARQRAASAPDAVRSHIRAQFQARSSEKLQGKLCIIRADSLLRKASAQIGYMKKRRIERAVRRRTNGEPQLMRVSAESLSGWVLDGYVHAFRFLKA